MMFTSLKNSKKGFTLIELLVVIAIIGILSSVVLASLSTARAKSRDAKRVSDVGQVQLALELFFDANQSYPTTTAGIAVLTVNKYLPQTPTPPAGSAASYAYMGVYSASGVATNCTNALTNACTGYALGIDLERTDNTVLASDADQPSSVAASAGISGGSADPALDDFAGISGTTCLVATNAGAGADKCYDVKP